MSSSPSFNNAFKSETYGGIFLRFLRFGLLAWGGPVAQIAMIRQELVEEEGWVTREHFNRILSVYQVMPGPEAHELCVFFGMHARGRLGGFLAGLGFMLPGFVFMFLLSWLYVAFGLSGPLIAAVFAGFQPAVAAMILRAIHRIGEHALTHPWLWAIALLTFAADLFGVGFLISLPAAGLLYVFLRRRSYLAAGAFFALVAAGMVAYRLIPFSLPWESTFDFLNPAVSGGQPGLLALFYSGLRSGLLTFGGAYTVIPFLQNDAVAVGGWMTNEQFLDGLALSGILPAPLIIFATFVGYLGAGALGALAITTGIFLPAFSFTLLGHKYLERVIENRALHNFLDGVTAGVVGLISATALGLLQVALDTPFSWLIFLAALAALYLWKAKVAVAFVVLGAGLAGLLFFSLF
jgi:chromate transporter